MQTPVLALQPEPALLQYPKRPVLDSAGNEGAFGDQREALTDGMAATCPTDRAVQYLTSESPKP